MNVGSAAPTTHIMASAWQSRSSTLSTLDVLTALEARSVQQDEATLHRLVEDLLTQGRIVEGLIATLEAETALRDDGTLSPAKVSVALPQSGVPAPIRPHLRWLMRARCSCCARLKSLHTCSLALQDQERSQTRARHSTSHRLWRWVRSSRWPSQATRSVVAKSCSRFGVLRSRHY